MSEFEAGIFELDGATEYQNWMIYGDSGCGKTGLAATVPGRIMFWAGEPGHIVAARQVKPGAKARLIPDTSTAVAAAAWMEDGHAAEYDWLIVDGIGTMMIKFLLGYAAEAFDANPSKRAHRNLPDKPDYYNAQNFMKSWCARLIDLPVNVLFTCHAMRPEDETGETLVYPSIQGKGYEVSNYISGLMHVCAYMRVGVQEVRGGGHRQVRRLLFQHYVDPQEGTRYFAKDQFHVLGRTATVKDWDDLKSGGVTMADLVAKCAAPLQTDPPTRKTGKRR